MRKSGYSGILMLISGLFTLTLPRLFFYDLMANKKGTGSPSRMTCTGKRAEKHNRKITFNIAVSNHPHYPT